MPDTFARLLEASDLGLAAGPSQHAAIGQLPATAREERKASQQHPARPGIQYGCLRDQDVRMVVIEGHAAILRPRGWAVLAKIAGRPTTPSHATRGQVTPARPARTAAV